MTIKYAEDVQVWKNGDIAIAYEMMKLGFTEYSLNKRKDVNAKVEFALFDGIVNVVLSYIPVEGNIHIYNSSTDSLLWSGMGVLNLERGESREDTERFVRGKVLEVLETHTIRGD